MAWNHFVWTVRLLGWIGFAMTLWSFWGKDNRKAQILNDKRIEFAPKKLAVLGSILIAVYFAYFTIANLVKHWHETPFDLLISACVGLVSLTIVFSLPGAIVVTADGVNQLFWFRKNKHIRWVDIVEINTGKKSRAVTITGVDRTKIVHSRQLADRSRLLFEVKQHCGESLPPDFHRESIASY